jgi:hypothetical protein
MNTISKPNLEDELSLTQTDTPKLVSIIFEVYEETLTKQLVNLEEGFSSKSANETFQLWCFSLSPSKRKNCWTQTDTVYHFEIRIKIVSSLEEKKQIYV